MIHCESFWKAMSHRFLYFILFYMSHTGQWLISQFCYFHWDSHKLNSWDTIQLSVFIYKGPALFITIIHVDCNWLLATLSSTHLRPNGISIYLNHHPRVHSRIASAGSISIPSGGQQEWPCPHTKDSGPPRQPEVFVVVVVVFNQARWLMCLGPIKNVILGEKGTS